MKLYWFKSFNPQKVRLALEELGVRYERITVDLFKGAQREPEFLALNPQGKVPVLQDGDFVLSESQAIVAYLGDKYQRIWPVDLEKRAHAMHWLFFGAAALEGSVGTAWFNAYVKKQIGKRCDDEAVAKAHTSVQSPMAYLDQQLVNHEYLMGDFTLTDCAIGPVLAALACTGFDWSPFPATQQYFERLRTRPAWQRSEIDY